MATTSTAQLFSPKTIITDSIILVLVSFIPAISHAVPFPLYLLEPMRLLLFAAFLIIRNDTNAYFLALVIPLVSTIVTGHPPFAKACLVSMELFVNMWMFVYLRNRVTYNASILFFVSTIASKVFYYGMKYLFIKLTLIEGALISTPLGTQFITLTALSLLVAIFYKKK